MPQRSWHPKKLLHSKWTAVVPQHREKHFIVVQVTVNPDDAQKIEQVTLEAVLSKRHFTLHWSALADETQWRVGWD
ncbi:TIGR02450 family Trp-rich protein [Chitinibacter sp. GC72]|uniref:TIGR02450 family Trp-rich protein n=1 Tax=Chitinibacter sp. GC72 TaxID=1526917 RepID=UPI0012F779B7|nr:TIGR02450 family Trp-rich protein [Chitinibacter sp. GC72]